MGDDDWLCCTRDSTTVHIMARLASSPNDNQGDEKGMAASAIDFLAIKKQRSWVERLGGGPIFILRHPRDLKRKFDFRRGMSARRSQYETRREFHKSMQVRRCESADM
jgi:hypothetical protein